MMLKPVTQRAQDSLYTEILTARGVNPRITYTQSGNLTYFDSTGTLQTAAADTMVKDYDPSTLALRGYPFWEQRTNSIRNNTMVGAAAGTPGTPPPNWQITAAGGSLTTVTIVGTATESGIDYIDVRFIASGATSPQIIFEQNTQVVAANGGTWTGEFFCRLVGGTLTNVAVSNRVQYRIAAGSNASFQDVAITPTSAGLATQRSMNTLTASNALTAFITGACLIAFSGAGDVTLRIGLPQLELGAFATPVIKTSTVAVTRGAPPNTFLLASIWNAAQGSGAITFIASTTVAGTRPILSLDDGTANNQIRIYTSGTSLVMTVTTAGVSRSITVGTVAANTQYKVAWRAQAGNNAAVMTGGTVQTDASGTMPIVTTGRLGLDFAGNAQNGWQSNNVIYQTALPNATLLSLVV